MKVICKRNYLYIHLYQFCKDEYYSINEIGSNYMIISFEHKHCFFDMEDFKNIFYSDIELRELKLKKLLK